MTAARLPVPPPISLLSLLLPPPPRSTLFPYTTLFRSRRYDRGTQRSPRSPSRRIEGRSARPGWHRSPSRFDAARPARSEEHTSELQSRRDLVCRLLLEKKKNKKQRA